MDIEKESNGVVGNVQESGPQGDRNQLIGEGSSLESHGEDREVEPLQLEAPHDHSQSQQKTSEGLKMIIVSSITFAVGVTVALIVTIYIAPPQVPPHGAVAAEVPQCAEVGTDIMQKGGSAVDAAIATTFCSGVIHPVHSGIGGGAFILIRQMKEKKSHAIDGREVAPATATPDMFESSPEDKVIGGKSVGVPGELAALKMAHDLYGKLPWRDVVMPAVTIAKEGFNVTKIMAEYLRKEDYSEGANQEFIEMFYPNGQPLEEGAVVTNEKLADTLLVIAEKGIDVFYNGTKADDIVNMVKLQGGEMELDDLSFYEAIARKPIQSKFLDMSVETFPTPAGGPILLLLLNIMEGYLKSQHKSKNETEADAQDRKNLMAHRLVEAIKFSYAQEVNFGDPLFVQNIANMTELVTSKEFASSIRNLTDDTATHEAEFYGKVPIDKGTHTSHISVIGPNEDHVAITTSLNDKFGSRVMVNGFILNNQMRDFDRPSSGLNDNNLPAGGKRPLSHMTPTVVHSRNRPCGVRVALGATNGSRIISGIAEVVMNMFGYSMPLKEAIKEPRIHATLDPDVIEFDSGFDKDVLADLQKKGHQVFSEAERGINFVNAVAKMNETVKAWGDRRNGGGESIF